MIYNIAITGATICVIGPTDYIDAKAYIALTKFRRECPEVTSFTFDDITITCHPADNPIIYGTEEDMSLVVTVTHGDNTMLLCGNACLLSLWVC